MRKSALFVTLLLVLVLAITVTAQGVGSARIRIAHLASDVRAVDVYIDGVVRSFGRGLEPATITSWITIPAGAHEIAVVPAGRNYGSAVIGPVELTFERDTYTTVAAIGAAFTTGVDPVLIVEDFTSPLTEVEARVTVFHTIPDGPIVDVLNGGELLLGRLGYPGSVTYADGSTNDGYTTLDIVAGTYDLAIVPNGQTGPAILDLSDTTIEGGMHYFIAATGKAANPQVVVASSPAQ